MNLTDRECIDVVSFVSAADFSADIGEERSAGEHDNMSDSD